MELPFISSTENPQSFLAPALIPTLSPASLAPHSGWVSKSFCELNPKESSRLELLLKAARSRAILGTGTAGGQRLGTSFPPRGPQPGQLEGAENAGGKCGPGEANRAGSTGFTLQHLGKLPVASPFSGKGGLATVKKRE